MKNSRKAHIYTKEFCTSYEGEQIEGGVNTKTSHLSCLSHSKGSGPRALAPLPYIHMDFNPNYLACTKQNKHDEQ